MEVSLDVEQGRFSRFVERSLFLHEAPVVDTLHFKLGGSGDIQEWIKTADKRSVLELIINIDTCSSNTNPVTLPKSLYTCWSLLVRLNLSNTSLVDDVSSSISFPLLKKLNLVSMKYPGDEFVNMLLSNCHVLEDLVVKQCPNDNITILSVRVPSLKSLYMFKSHDRKTDAGGGLVIDAPSLECLSIYDYSYGFCVIENNMTKIVKANIVVGKWHLGKKFLGCISSAKRLYLCIPTSKDAYPVGNFFSSFVYLRICTCETEWLNLLIRALRDSPNLKALKLQQCHELRDHEPRPSWNETSLVPEYLLCNLETLEWKD